MTNRFAFLPPKIEFSPSNPTSEKIIASFKVFSSVGAILCQKIEKVSQKKNIFLILLLAIILLPLKYPIWITNERIRLGRFFFFRNGTTVPIY